MERDQPSLPAGASDAALSDSSAGVRPLAKPRTPWLAALLGLVSSPLAFAYVGKAAWGVGVNALVVALFAALGQSGFVQSAAGIWSLLAASLVALLLCIVLPWRFAIAARQQYRLKWYNRWYWYVLFVALVNAPGSYLFLHHARYFGFDTFRVPSGSMSTTINPGELIVADTRPSVVSALKPGDIAVMWSSRRSELYVKRIVAGPGQHVQIEDAGLKVDGVLQDRTHTIGTDTMQAKWMRYADVQLGADEYYLMGDNRGNSFDSRTEGPVPRADLRAKVSAICFSRDTSRIGKLD